MLVTNKKFHRDYQEIEKYEVGIVLTGAEVKSVRAKRIKLEDSFVKLLGSEAYLVNSEVQIYEHARPDGYDLRRTRKLLLHKKEIIRLKTKIASGNRLTVIPYSCYNKGGLIKLEIVLCKPRKDIEKKNLEKKQDIKRQQLREAKEYMKM